ncbi:hypothetical protein GJ744_012221 [Endocarpon pusillum]|uniref:CHAT domain-containing protein n=1 Tax=Endocarpon pusillum TaxID=364733 RepID=A0A8H7E1P7_9EURO|nr:hypothetical protein GJ744_012221 [Endocarpon pusillum]
MRADTFELQEKHPRLAEEYISLLDQLDIPNASSQRQVDQRIVAAQHLEITINTIRKLSGFDRFLLAPSEDELRTAAERGPIVVISVSVYRCDALIVEASGLRSLSLPHLDCRDLNYRARTMEDFGAPEVLEWLWESVAQPVLDALGFTQLPSDNCWPRMWWIPTGPLSKFPLHAAGHHADNSVETVLDRVISSYSSSIRAIIHGRRQQSSSETTVSASAKALLIAIEHTPGSSRLPFAKREVEMLKDLCPSMALQPTECGRRKQDVMSHLAHCKVFHFAGHGYTDRDDPLKSHLLLENGKSDALTVADILRLNCGEHSPFLAYLSACETGRVKDEYFEDENIHLISAYQLAGYRHVIGTMWEVEDEMCVEIARITYESIRDLGMTDESVCWGLHKAVRKLRDRWLIGIPEQIKRGSKLASEENTSLEVDEVVARGANTDDQRDARMLRDVVPCDDDDQETPLWIPYVHFGV